MLNSRFYKHLQEYASVCEITDSPSKATLKNGQFLMN